MRLQVLLCSPSTGFLNDEPEVCESRPVLPAEHDLYKASQATAILTTLIVINSDLSSSVLLHVSVSWSYTSV